MKVRWKGETDFLVLTKDKVYDVLSVEKGWYRVVDDSGENYLYPPEKFEIVDDNIEPADTNEWQLPDILKKAKNSPYTEMGLLRKQYREKFGEPVNDEEFIFTEKELCKAIRMCIKTGKTLSEVMGYDSKFYSEDEDI